MSVPYVGCFLFICLKVAHHSVRDQLLGYIYNGFLVPVLAPALHKVIIGCLLALIYFAQSFLIGLSSLFLSVCQLISWLWRKWWRRQLIWSSFCGTSPTPPSSRLSLFSSSSIAMTTSTFWIRSSAESTLLFRFQAAVNSVTYLTPVTSFRVLLISFCLCCSWERYLWLCFALWLGCTVRTSCCSSFSGKH